jgi:hypothetical protein
VAAKDAINWNIQYTYIHKERIKFLLVNGEKERAE